ncbi:amino acid transporter [Jaminaea rosea]|uniref:Amino acid transporter n=1 Tax=Jaminaea rosea TaxID=1569628 RepID=A0A316UUF4_9BASI|nr:amino acid transporter [Jaminaea rosea]PWN28936.1 amino acid transporter [Jaminaea rosea]
MSSTIAAAFGRRGSNTSNSEKDHSQYPSGDPVVRHNPVGEDDSSEQDDDARLAQMGYKSEFKREFRSLSTFSFAMAIMGLVSSVITTFNTPLLSGGGPSVIWTWFIGSVMNMTLGVSIGELVSAFPSCGGLYSASGYLVPKRYSKITAYGVGWANGLGQIAGISGSAYGLSSMIMAWAYVITDGRFVASTGEIVGLYIGIMVIAGVINSFPTSWLARLTASYVFVNLITTCVIAILVLARTPSGEYTSGADAFVNISGASGWSKSLAFLIGLQMVQFVMTDYDATAHISEEVSRAAIAAPVAIVQAVFVTGLMGFFLNIALVFAMGDVASTDITTWPGELAVAQILLNRGGKVAFLVVWPFACAVAFFVVITAVQANARTFFALARDRAIPGWFAIVEKRTKVTINAVWLVVLANIILIQLAWINYTAIAAIFSLAALGMDLSYWVPIVGRTIFADHPEVRFREQKGPFYLGEGLFGQFIRWTCIVWTLFECIVLAIPSTTPVTAMSMNWSSVVFGGVMILAFGAYAVAGHRYYIAPGSQRVPSNDTMQSQSPSEGSQVSNQEKL